MQDQHKRFQRWLFDGGHGRPARDLAVHAAVCAECTALAAGLSALSSLDLGTSPVDARVGVPVQAPARQPLPVAAIPAAGYASPAPFPAARPTVSAAVAAPPRPPTPVRAIPPRPAASPVRPAGAPRPAPTPQAARTSAAARRPGAAVAPAAAAAASAPPARRGLGRLAVASAAVLALVGLVAGTAVLASRGGFDIPFGQAQSAQSPAGGAIVGAATTASPTPTASGTSSPSARPSPSDEATPRPSRSPRPSAATAGSDDPETAAVPTPRPGRDEDEGSDPAPTARPGTGANPTPTPTPFRPAPTPTPTPQPPPPPPPATPSVFFAGDTQATELFAGQSTMTFVVRLSGPTSVPVTVSYSTMPVGGDPATEGGACGAGVDYIRSAGTLTFQPGEVEKRIGVAVCDDVFLEGETLAVNLTGATNATISDAQAIGTINDDSKDAVPEP